MDSQLCLKDKHTTNRRDDMGKLKGGDNNEYGKQRKRKAKNHGDSKARLLDSGAKKKAAEDGPRQCTKQTKIEKQRAFKSKAMQ